MDSDSSIASVSDRRPAGAATPGHLDSDIRRGQGRDRGKDARPFLALSDSIESLCAIDAAVA
jgi:hypothetical protein